MPSEIRKAEVQTSRLASCLDSGDSGSGNDCAADDRTAHLILSSVIYLGHILLRIGSKDN